MSGFKYFCYRSQTTFWFCMQPSVSKYCDCTEFRYHLQELLLQPGPFVSILYILYTAETAEPPIIVLIVINWQMIRRNDTNFRFGQTSALHDAGEECPCSWWVGATLQLDILHSLRWMLLTARRLQYWNVSAISRISTGVHTLDPLRWLSSWLCAGRSWAGLGIWRHDMGMTRVWQGYDDTLFPDHRTRTWQHTRLVLGSSGWGNVDH